MRGLFITFEGMDGVGKTTQLKKVNEYFMEKGYQTVLTREPGGTIISEKIRDIILDVSHREMDDITEALLYAAARSQHVSQVIKPALDSGKMVLCDRFVDSSIAYQGYGRQLGPDRVAQINAPALHGVQPHLTLFFHLSPQESLKRTARRKGPQDRLEQEEYAFHQRVYQGFHEIAQKHPQRIRKIDANRSIGQVFGEVREHIEYLLACQK